jgi:hypothetical protein
MPSECLKAKQDEHKLAKRLKRHGVPFGVRKQHQHSLQEEKIKFIDDFERNLELMQNREEYPTTKIVTNKMTYDRKENIIKVNKSGLKQERHQKNDS